MRPDASVLVVGRSKSIQGNNLTSASVRPAKNDMHNTHDIDLSFLDDTPAPPLASAPTPEKWSTPLALALMDATDAAVERHGSHGTDPVIQTTVKAVNDAHGRRVMAGIRDACSKIVERTKELAAHKSHKGAA